MLLKKFKKYENKEKIDKINIIIKKTFLLTLSLSKIIHNFSLLP